MACFAIMERKTGNVILVVEGGSLPRALERAARSGVLLAGANLVGAALGSAFLYRARMAGADLAGANLAGAYLREADLREADLTSAALQGAFLKGADLRGADLRGANLARADLRSAALTGALLAGANLDRAQLDGALLDWRQAPVAIELLRRDLPVLQGGSRLVFDLAFHDDDRPYAWLTRLLAHDPPERVLTTLARRVRKGDNAPEILRRLAATRPSPEKTSSASSLRAAPAA